MFCSLLRVIAQCSSQYVSRIDLLLSFLSPRKKWKHCQCVEQRCKIILRHLTKLHTFMGSVANALRIIEKRCNAF